MPGGQRTTRATRGQRRLAQHPGPHRRSQFRQPVNIQNDYRLATAVTATRRRRAQLTRPARAVTATRRRPAQLTRPARAITASGCAPLAQAG